MVTRRKFLQSNLVGLALPLASSGVLNAAPMPAENANAAPGAERDYWNDWPRYVTAEMNQARARRLADLRKVRSEADVRARVEKIRSTVWKLIGGEFEKTPLNPQITGKINRGDYTIEKVIFESHPQIYVTANLYIPARRQPPHPGIIAPLGHSSNGKEYRSYQCVYQNLARKGYMVLAFDPFGQGERCQYLDPRTGKPTVGPTGEHNRAGYPMLLFGSTFARYRAWDGIRALDYLLSRPEVDHDRIGCTGQSGGGTMTMYLAALEPRIKVAVEVDGNSENLAGPNYMPPGGVADSEQNLIFSLSHGIDRGDLIMAFAPKPILMCYTPTDRGVTYSPTYDKGTQEVFAEAQAAYKLMNAGEKVGIFASPMPHDYDFFNRRAAYGWFNKWLGSPDWGTDEAPYEESAPGTLDCTSTAQVLTSIGGRTVVDLSVEEMRKVRPTSSNTPDRAALRNSLKELLVLPANRTPLSAHTISSHTRKGLVLEEFDIHSERSVRVHGWVLKPATGSGPFPAVLRVAEGRTAGVVAETSEFVSLAGRGFLVCSVELRGIGDLIPHLPVAGPVFYSGDGTQEDYALASFTLGKPVLGQLVWDCLRSLDYLQTRHDVDQNRIHGLGESGAALVMLMSAALDDRIKSVLLDRPVATLASIVEATTYSLKLPWYLYGVLKHFDLPDLAASLAPKPLWLLNATNAQGEPLAELETAAAYKPASGAYAQLNAEKKLYFVVSPDRNRVETLRKWLNISL